MADSLFLLAGLGNPGKKYENTRHNVGFRVIDLLARQAGVRLHTGKWNAAAVRVRLFDNLVYLVKPETFMNASGRALAPMSRFYRIATDNMLIIHDDIDMAVGRIKLVKGGGSGGHNGIKSLVQELGTAAFFRLKIGVGRPGQGDAHGDMSIEKYVLAPFSETEEIVINDRIKLLENGLASYIRGDVQRAMTYLNSLQ